MGIEADARSNDIKLLDKQFFNGNLSSIVFNRAATDKFAVKFKLLQRLLFAPKLGIESDASIAFKYKGEKGSISTSFSNDSRVTTSFKVDASKYLKNTTISLEEEADLAVNQFNLPQRLQISRDEERYTLNLAYRNDERRFLTSEFLFKGRCEKKKPQGQAADPKADVGRYGYGVAGAYNLDRKDFSIYKLLGYYHLNNLQISFTLRNEKVGFEPEKCLAALWHRVNDKNQIAVHVEHNLKFNQTRFVLGARSQLSDNLTLKFKVDEHFKADTAWIYAISPKISLALMTKHDLKPSREKLIDTIIPFGVRLHIADDKN